MVDCAIMRDYLDQLHAGGESSSHSSDKAAEEERLWTAAREAARTVKLAKGTGVFALFKRKAHTPLRSAKCVAGRSAALLLKRLQQEGW
jgi:hypothetical protein